LIRDALAAKQNLVDKYIVPAVEPSGAEIQSSGRWVPTMAITWEEETTTAGSGTAKRNGAPSGLRDAGSNDKSDDEAGVGDGVVGGKAAGATNAGGAVAGGEAAAGVKGIGASKAS
jgi:hypothetical protein